MINFKTGNEPKMKLFDFGAFQNFKQMLSRDKIIFRMPFGAFHVTPRNFSFEPKFDIFGGKSQKL